MRGIENWRRLMTGATSMRFSRSRRPTTIQELEVSERWDDIYAGPIESDDLATFITLDASDSIYLTGSSDTGLLTARYDPAGQRIWLDVYVTGPFVNRGNGVAIDADGNVVSAGQSPILTVHYNQKEPVTLVENLGSSGAVGAFVTLEPAAPNPSRRASTIRFHLTRPSHARLCVYNVAGRNVATLVDGPLSAGIHEVVFAPKTLSSGVYIYALEAGGERLARRLELLR